MTLRIINSKLIKLAEYKPKNQNLIIYYQNGEKFEAVNVPVSVFEDLISARDVDNYYLENIKSKY
ncbi:MAG: KTSC domain-containing protein [Methanobacteriaceae archaeon]|jgi:hypothetical protein|nr:KTSC domain-containing protein [Methanobacteriaceae archaeon]